MQTVGQRQCLLINSPATDNETFFKLLLSRQVQGRMQRCRRYTAAKVFCLSANDDVVSLWQWSAYCFKVLRP